MNNSAMMGRRSSRPILKHYAGIYL